MTKMRRLCALVFLVTATLVNHAPVKAGVSCDLLQASCGTQALYPFIAFYCPQVPPDCSDFYDCAQEVGCIAADCEVGDDGAMRALMEC
jgi:hypothetical protein